MSQAAVSVEKLSKKYVIDHRYSGGDGLRHAAEAALRNPVRWVRSRRERAVQKEIFWALSDVSFTVEQGEAVGVIGRNGAGKSTLLKLLSRITEPTEGRIRYRGRVSSLLEVGTGFHPELTGRENIFLNAAILGMRRSDIRRRFDEIVAFAEVEQFLDTPVKRYSSGMYVRLAFSVAAHLEPEILLVDEVLSVGDANFQKKCLGKMGDVIDEGRTVLFVSHSMAAVSALCTRAILIDQGRLLMSGSPVPVIEEYLARGHAEASTDLSQRTDRTGGGRIRFSEALVLNDRNEPVETVTSGQNVRLRLAVDVPEGRPLDNVVVQVKFYGTVGQALFACLSRASVEGDLSVGPGSTLYCDIPRLPLAPGAYSYTVWCTVGGSLEDLVRDAGVLAVVDGDYYGTGRLPPREVGDFLVDHAWTVE